MKKRKLLLLALLPLISACGSNPPADNPGENPGGDNPGETPVEPNPDTPSETLEDIGGDKGFVTVPEEPEPEPDQGPFTIEFRNADGTLLASDRLDRGDLPIAPDTTPTLESTSEYKFTFKEWYPSLEPVTQDQVYIATYDLTKRFGVSIVDEYTNEDYSTTYADEGSTFTLPEDTPTRPDTAKYSYEYDTENPFQETDLTIDRDTVLTANFIESYRTFEVELYSVSGTKYGETLEVTYGQRTEIPASIIEDIGTDGSRIYQATADYTNFDIVEENGHYYIDDYVTEDKTYTLSEESQRSFTMNFYLNPTETGGTAQEIEHVENFYSSESEYTLPYIVGHNVYYEVDGIEYAPGKKVDLTEVSTIHGYEVNETDHIPHINYVTYDLSLDTNGDVVANKVGYQGTYNFEIPVPQPRALDLTSKSYRTLKTVGDGTNPLFDSSVYGNLPGIHLALPTTVTTIAANTFSNATGLNSVYIGENITSIGENAFELTNTAYVYFERASDDDVATGFASDLSLFSATEEFSNFNYDTPYSVAVGNFTYEFNADKTATLTKINTMGQITIPENVELFGETYEVTTIGDGSNHVFKYSSSYHYLTLPDTIKLINDHAFDGVNTYLRQINLPKGITRIGNRAFYNCSYVSFSTLPFKLEEIGDEAFYSCKFGILRTIFNINYSEDEFEGTTISGRLLDLPPFLKTIGDSAFDNVDLEYVLIPKGVTEIGTYAFDSYYYDTLYFEHTEEEVQDLYTNGTPTGYRSNIRIVE